MKNLLTALSRKGGLVPFGRKLTPAPHALSGDDWQQANPRWIEGSLEHALSRSSGGWFVLDASRLITEEPRKFWVDGHELVAWRHGGQLRVAPNACPHMGASLADGYVNREGCIVCPWHALALGKGSRGTWAPHRTFDDGVLAWVRLDHSEVETKLSDSPVITERPTRFLDGVIRMEADCEPRDVIQNRLDPWHGVHFHPYAFGSLHVIAQSEDDIVVRVAYRVAGPLAMEVDARFHSPDARTIVMTIVAGDGEGSVVETHATPIAPGRTAIIEATLATSDRPGFSALSMLGRRLVRPLIENAARQLWIDDAAYAERLYFLRTQAKRERRISALRPVG